MIQNANPYFPEVPFRLLVKGDVISGILCVPRGAKGIVILVNGIGESRRTLPLQFIASTLQKAEIATLAVDLLTEEELMSADSCSNDDLLVDRLLSVIHWVWESDQTTGLPIGLFGADRGAAVVLQTGCRLGEEFKAIVAFGENYDLDFRELHMIKAPTLLIVPSSDGAPGEPAHHVFRELCCIKKMEVIPETSFLYNHERASEIIAPLSTCWFHAHLCHVEAACV